MQNMQSIKNLHISWANIEKYSHLFRPEDLQGNVLHMIKII